MKFLKPLNVLLFVLSFALGSYYIMYVTPEKRRIYVFPTPENVDELQYTDLAENCFKYEPQKVSCPKDKSKIANYKVQGV